jgi:hypothetical protein
MPSQSLRTFAVLIHLTAFLLVCVFCLPGGAVLVEIARIAWTLEFPMIIEAELACAAAVLLAVCLASNWTLPRSLGWAMTFMGHAALVNALVPGRPADPQLTWLGVGAAIGAVVGLLSGTSRRTRPGKEAALAGGTGPASAADHPRPVGFRPGWRAVLAGSLAVAVIAAFAVRYELCISKQARIAEAVARCDGKTIYDNAGTPPLVFKWLDLLPCGNGRLCLRSVELGSQAGNAELAELAEMGLGSLPHLRELRMRHSRVTDDGLAIVAPLLELERISLGRATTDAGLALLDGLPALRVLDLSRTRITGEGLRSASHLPVLACLHLQNTRITNDDLARLRCFDQLITLDLSATSIGDAGLVHLAQLPNLSSLMLIETPVTDAGLKHLAEIPQLKWVFLARSKVTRSGLAEFRRSRPSVWTD